MTDKLRDAEREAFEAWVAKVQPAYWRAEAWQTEAWAMWQSISAALAQQDAQAVVEAIRAEPTEMIHKWRVLELIQAHDPTPPAQRVMLTDEEIHALWFEHAPIAPAVIDFAQVIIEAYERKNGAETTPPAPLPEARQWTGLTDIGVYFAITAAGKPPNPMSEEFFAWCEKFADAIEANLKERNA